jgi:hypothetical protein
MVWPCIPPKAWSTAKPSPLHPCGLPPRFLGTTPRWGASMFLWLWLGHMYMGSKGLPMHSSRSPVYGKTLARCTRAVYPPRFLRTKPRWGASVFHVLWLGHMNMGSKGLPMHSPPSSVYGETLASCIRKAYHPRSRRCHTGGLVCFFGSG